MIGTNLSTKNLIKGLFLLALIGRGFSYEDYSENDEDVYRSDDEYLEEDDTVPATKENPITEKPSFSVEEINKTFIPNEDVALECPAPEPGPDSLIVWRKGDFTLSQDSQTFDPSKYHVDVIDDITKLTIIQANESDEAVYSCEVFPNNISLKFNLVAGSEEEVAYSGGSTIAVTGAFLIAVTFLRT